MIPAAPRHAVLPWEVHEQDLNGSSSSSSSSSSKKVSKKDADKEALAD